MSLELRNFAAWSADWAWGLPLIVAIVVFHAYGLGLINSIRRRSGWAQPRRRLAFVIGGMALSATVLHAVEAFSWATAYYLLGALPDRKSAVIYSLNAMTSYGHVELYLASRWQLMGALEALNGWILFGLTAAFLFAVLQLEAA